MTNKPVVAANASALILAKCSNVNYLLRRASEYKRGRRIPKS